MEAIIRNNKLIMNSSTKEISDYFLNIILNIKGDSAKIDESANSVFSLLSEYEKSHLINALNKISNRI